MSYRETQSLIQLVLSLVLLGFYIAMALGLWDGEGPGLWAYPVALFALLAVLIWQERRREPEDERDRMIRHRAYGLAMGLFYVGFFLLIALQEGLFRSAPVDSAALLCLATAAMSVAAASKLYLYRRGA